MNLTSSGSCLTPLYDHYKQVILAILPKHVEFTRKQWIKEGVFILKHPQFKVYLIGTYFGFDLWVLSLLTFLVFFLIRLIEENGQIKALKSSSVEVKVQTLSLHFSCLFVCFCVLLLWCLCMRFRLFNLYIISMIGC